LNNRNGVLFLQLIKEFDAYRSKQKENKNSPLLSEAFIKEKIKQCNEEKKNFGKKYQ
jgi:hypothetical protein